MSDLIMRKIRVETIVVKPFVLALLTAQLFSAAARGQQEFYVTPTGDDGNTGTLERPFATIDRARKAVRGTAREDGEVTVFLRSGTYHLKEPLQFTSDDTGHNASPVVYRSYPGEKAVISGGVELAGLSWRRWKEGIMRTWVDMEKHGYPAFDQLYIDGLLMRMARYPNYDSTAQFLGGTSPDAISAESVQRWKDPAGGYLHALHEGKWGSKHYRIDGVGPDGGLVLTGGWQENRGGTDKDVQYREGYHKELLYVENIFEELDDYGEWYFDDQKSMLYVKTRYPERLDDAKIVTANLRQLITVKGTTEQPVRHIRFEEIEFRHTRRIFMEPYERLLRGDWSIARLSAVFFEGTEHCGVVDCNFEDLGGNAVFFSKRNYRGYVKGSRFVHIGESGVCLVGSLDAVRSPSVEYRNNVPYDEMDDFPGPKTKDYPLQCVVENAIMHDLGLVGKQVAGVFVSMSEEIEVRHNTIYDVPRAAICINDGCWGGHVIEHNDAFNTVRESGDHGPFNSWGRDRYWLTRYHGRDKGNTEGAKKRALLDNYKTTIIRHNRFAHPGGHSWGIDLDDGSSNYHVYNNLCLGMGIKLREGFYRRVENNIIVNGFGGFHVWFEDCDDVFEHNIIVDKQPYRFIAADPHAARSFDYNLFYAGGEDIEITGLGEPLTFATWQSMGFDVHSVLADPMFVDTEHGDYRVRSGSPALQVGFQNFRMDNFGVYKEVFVREVAREDRKHGIRLYMSDPDMRSRDAGIHQWLGARIKNLTGAEEMSAAGIGEITGVLMVDVPDSSVAEKAGFRTGDVIVEINGVKIHALEDLYKAVEQGAESLEVTVDGNPTRRTFRCRIIADNK
jgi:hypothetical protein